jgi:hypothetical protein
VSVGKPTTKVSSGGALKPIDETKKTLAPAINPVSNFFIIPPSINIILILNRQLVELKGKKNSK